MVSNENLPVRYVVASLWLLFYSFLQQFEKLFTRSLPSGDWSRMMYTFLNLLFVS